MTPARARRNGHSASEYHQAIAFVSCQFCAHDKNWDHDSEGKCHVSGCNCQRQATGAAVTAGVRELAVVQAASTPIATPPPPAPETDLGAVLSPSQLNNYLDCSARWWYRSGLKLPERRGAKQALGSAIHRAIAENFKQKLESREDLPGEGMAAIFKLFWDAECSGYSDPERGEQPPITFHSTDKPAAELAETGVGLVRLYMDRVAGRIDPAAVELPVSGVISGVPVRGYVDLLDTEGRVIDVKTAKARPPSGIREDYRRQVATYVAIAPAVSGEARIDTLVKTKTLDHVEQSFTVNGADRQGVQALYPAVQAAMRGGLYLPNRSSRFCSRRDCSYWEACEADFGGQVKGEAQ